MKNISKLTAPACRLSSAIPSNPKLTLVHLLSASLQTLSSLPSSWQLATSDMGSELTQALTWSQLSSDFAPAYRPPSATPPIGKPTFVDLLSASP